MAQSQPEPIRAIGALRTPAEILETLGRHFHARDKQTRKIGNRQVEYLSVAAVTERLNMACNTWDFRIVKRDRETMMLNRWNEQTRKSEPREVTVSIVIGELEIPELGCRQAIGVQALDDGSGEDLLKGAASDALKKCASLFGVRVDAAEDGEITRADDAGTGPAARPAPAGKSSPTQQALGFLEKEATAAGLDRPMLEAIIDDEFDKTAAQLTIGEIERLRKEIRDLDHDTLIAHARTLIQDNTEK